jgi:hypothetical protein
VTGRGRSNSSGCDSRLAGVTEAGMIEAGVTESGVTEAGRQ